MIPPWDHSEFFRKLDEGVEIAHFLGTPRMVVGSGTGFGGWKRQVQLDKLIEIYQKAIAQIDGSGITLVLEPVNVRVDHPGVAARPHRARPSTSRAASTRRSSACSTTSTTRPSRARMSRPSSRTPATIIKYVQLADAPGRGEPGTGSTSTGRPRLGDLRASGYDGPIGLEYYPQTASAESVQATSSELAATA